MTLRIRPRVSIWLGFNFRIEESVKVDQNGYQVLEISGVFPTKGSSSSNLTSDVTAKKVVVSKHLPAIRLRQALGKRKWMPLSPVFASMAEESR